MPKSVSETRLRSIYVFGMICFLGFTPQSFSQDHAEELLANYLVVAEDAGEDLCVRFTGQRLENDPELAEPVLTSFTGITACSPKHQLIYHAHLKEGERELVQFDESFSLNGKLHSRSCMSRRGCARPPLCKPMGKSVRIALLILGR